MPVINSGILFALAHPADEAVTPAALWGSWTFEPVVVVLLIATACAYGLGVRRLWTAAGTGQGISRTQAAAFAGGWAVLVIALVSPIDALSDALFSVHMVQHELLILVAAPLMVLGAPLVAFVWALPPGVGKRAFAAVRAPVSVAAWAAISAPASVWVLHAVALWVWHVPSLYQAALESEFIHGLEHSCFFVTAALFWWGLTRGRYGRLGYGAAVV